MSRRAKGEGTIRERTYTRSDGSTYTRYAAVVNITLPTGGRKRVYGRNRETREDARRDLTTMTAARDGMVLSTARTQLGTYLATWLDEKRLDLRDRTVMSYQHTIDAHIVPLLGRVRLNELSPQHVKHLVTTLRRDASNHVARQARSVLHNALNDAVRMELVARNVATVVKAPPAAVHNGPEWDSDQVLAFLDACRSARHGRLYLLILGTGLRAGEALGLTWANVTPDAVKVTQQLATVGRPVLVPPKTERSRRTIPIGMDVHGILTEQGDHVERQREHAGAAWREHDLVFPSTLGTPLRLENVRRDFNRTLDRAASSYRGGDMPRVRIHDLRHWHFTRLVAHGVDVDTVSRRAGHSRTSTTLDLYVHGAEDAAATGAVPIVDLARDRE